MDLQIELIVFYSFHFAADNDLNLKGAQQDGSNVTGSNAQADQILPAAQEQIDQNVECDSNDIQDEAVPPVAAPSQDSSIASPTGEVSSSYDQPVSTTSGVSSSVNYSDSSDDADDCPVFEYSAESMQVAKESNDSPESTSKSADQNPIDDNMENDEDLVQLDDDEHFANETGISDEQVNQTQADMSQTIESPIASPETTTNTGTECSENVSMNYACESNEPPPNLSQCLDKETEDVSETEAEVDGEAEDTEIQPNTTNTPDTAESVSNEKNATSKAGIEGMDTEMISEDEMLHDDTQNAAKEHHKADKEENNNRKSERDESFKKVSKNNKERNYRDKRDKSDAKSKRKRSRSRGNRRSRSRSSRRSSSSSSSGRSRSRSRSRSRNRSGRRMDKRPQRKADRERRQEIQRYDVRTLIADRQPRNHKDKYGRDSSRQRSLSPRRVVRSRSRSKSYSRSISPGNFLFFT